MFKARKINKLKEKIAGLESSTDALDTLVNSGSKIPLYYVNKLLEDLATLGGLKERLRQLEASNELS